MRAFLIKTPGGAQALYQEAIDLPVFGNDEVLVETKAISINPADVKVAMAEEGLQMIGGDERPLILGWDIAGTVAAVGDAVSHFSVGDRVFGMVNFPGLGKAYAEYVAAPASQLARIPAGISNVDAAATTLAALTALLVLSSKVKDGTKVLVHAGSGGVGHFAIQIAKAKGAYVITTTSAKNRDLVLALGADEHIDYRTKDFSAVLSDVDFVFDTQGGETLEKSLNVLSKGGTVGTIAAMEIPADLAKKAADQGVSIDLHLVQSNGKDMAELAGMLAEGTLRPAIDKVFAFDDLPQAHMRVLEGRSVGKVIVEL